MYRKWTGKRKAIAICPQGGATLIVNVASQAILKERVGRSVVRVILYAACGVDGSGSVGFGRLAVAH